MAKDRTAQQPAGNAAPVLETRVVELGRDIYASIVAGMFGQMQRQPEHIAGECLKLAAAFYEAAEAKPKQEG